ncbi:MAG: bifunctional demethylmenaquinone methyltransferase/2-methoxy-6-polyprenyl-1,4-benzoquinol methylase UbiE [Gammaproteobacteria bacterium]|nr:bifunctional demethylmenaquinone methyltransferase/2-methoxy-6-polyprenyl-1,4-benzoquinol methylase UbiE [Gammaproteobacteria bacterium]MDH3559331.1 bifunctional demethylmenaquinone methyltransferase/2-methoxy-6-polyprenyl-1,4-benzoquinol methylase UbiE [Gammaproteobacteria bacterium]
MKDKITHFGFEEVPEEEKAHRVRAVFDSVVDNYDLMNDAMSLGIHRLWKRLVIDMANIRPGQQVLDLAGGTGDLARLIAARTGPQGKVILSDINHAMIRTGRARLLDNGVAGNLDFIQANAEQLPFADNSFDCITMGFGLRNVTDKQAALDSIYRVLKPGGRLLVLEFSHPVAALKPAYDFYSFKILPRLGQLFANDADSYRYLAESIRMHPDQQTLLAMLESAGFEDCSYQNLTGGVVAVHRGFKF